MSNGMAAAKPYNAAFGVPNGWACKGETPQQSCQLAPEECIRLPGQLPKGFENLAGSQQELRTSKDAPLLSNASAWPSSEEDPWFDCDDIAVEDLIEFLADFAKKQQREASQPFQTAKQASFVPRQLSPQPQKRREAVQPVPAARRRRASQPVQGVRNACLATVLHQEASPPVQATRQASFTPVLRGWSTSADLGKLQPSLDESRPTVSTCCSIGSRSLLSSSQPSVRSLDSETEARMVARVSASSAASMALSLPRLEEVRTSDILDSTKHGSTKSQPLRGWGPARSRSKSPVLVVAPAAPPSSPGPCKDGLERPDGTEDVPGWSVSSLLTGLWSSPART